MLWMFSFAAPVTPVIAVASPVASSPVTVAVALFNVTATFSSNVTRPSAGNVSLSSTSGTARVVVPSLAAIYGPAEGRVFTLGISLASPYGPGTVTVSLAETFQWYSAVFTVTFGSCCSCYVHLGRFLSCVIASHTPLSTIA